MFSFFVILLTLIVTERLALSFYWHLQLRDDLLCHFIVAYSYRVAYLIVLSACESVFISSWSFYNACNYMFSFFVILLALTVTGRLALSFYRHAGFIYPVFVILLAHFVILSNLLSFYRFHPFCHFIDRCHYSDKHPFVILSLRSFRHCLRYVLSPAGAVCCALRIPFGCAGALG